MPTPLQDYRYFCFTGAINSLSTKCVRNRKKRTRYKNDVDKLKKLPFLMAGKNDHFVSF